MSKTKKRSQGVNGRNYVTHIAYTDKTLCGLTRSRVNCQGQSELNTEGTCRRCVAVEKGRPE